MVVFWVDKSIFLQDEPHVKCAINSTVFLPWEYTSFVTSGTDHTVMLWSKNFPSFCSLWEKNGSQNHCIGIFILLLSWELLVFSTRKLFCLLVKTREFWGTMLTWEDKISYIRLKQKEVHAFGWKQARRDMQSALVNQDWSSNGLYITSRSNDPLIHIFSYHFEFLLVYLHFT